MKMAEEADSEVAEFLTDAKRRRYEQLVEDAQKTADMEFATAGKMIEDLRRRTGS